VKQASFTERLASYNFSYFLDKRCSKKSVTIFVYNLDEFVANGIGARSNAEFKSPSHMSKTSRREATFALPPEHSRVLELMSRWLLHSFGLTWYRAHKTISQKLQTELKLRR
jgi:hypothetical protein